MSMTTSRTYAPPGRDSAASSPAALSLVRAARTFLGVPFVHAGRDRNGVDCVGLVLAAAAEAGLFDYTPRPYQRGDHSRLIAEVTRFAAPAAGDPVPGDLLLMRVRGELTHVALVTEAGTIIHAHERVGRVVEQTLTAELLGRVAVVYRWRGA